MVQLLGFSSIVLKVRAILHESAIAGHGSGRITAYDVVYSLKLIMFCCAVLGDLSSCSKIQRLFMDNNQLINTKVI